MSKSTTVNSIQFAEFLNDLCNKLGFGAGTKKNHWQFMRFIRRHRDRVSQRVGETVSIVKLRRHKNAKFSGVAILSEQQVIEYLKIHRRTKNVVGQIAQKLKDMPGFAPLPQKLEKLRFVAGEYGNGVKVDPSKYAEVKKKCLRIPNHKDRNQITFLTLKNGQPVTGCLVMTAYKAHYTVIHIDEKELYLSEKDLEFPDFPDDNPNEKYIVEHRFVEERQEMQIEAGAIFKIDRVHPEDPRYFECRAFCYGSEHAVILIHYSAVIALDIEMRREVIKLINYEGLVQHCQVFDVRLPNEAPKPPKASKRMPPYPVIFA